MTNTKICNWPNGIKNDHPLVNPGTGIWQKSFQHLDSEITKLMCWMLEQREGEWWRHIGFGKRTKWRERKGCARSHPEGKQALKISWLSSPLAARNFWSFFSCHNTILVFIAHAFSCLFWFDIPFCLHVCFLIEALSYALFSMLIDIKF